jgi:tRNA-dihydrouridine synthase 4
VKQIVAEDFVNSKYSREIEFQTSGKDKPLIVQFGAKNSVDLLNASLLLYKYVDGIDLSCGCPQSWAIQEGMGSNLIEDEERLSDMIKTLRRNLPTCVPFSIKIRLLKDPKRTMQLVNMLDKSDCLSWLTGKAHSIK